MTSGEYAYDLLRRLQRQFRCTDSGHRMYLYNFFGEIFNDPSVVITAEAHAAFCAQMESDATMYAEKGLTSLKSIYNDDSFGESFQMLQNSFASIGITLEKSESDSSAKLIFTLPNGTVKTISDGQGLSSSYLCARTGVDYAYAQQMMPFYDFEDAPTQDLTCMPTNVAGYGTTWTYDGNGELEVSGAGSIASSQLYSDLGIRNQVTKFIIGAGVNRLMTSSLSFLQNMTFVFLHGEADAIQIDASFSGSTSNTEIAYYYDVYTDNTAIRQAVFRSNAAVTFHPLSEWEG